MAVMTATAGQRAGRQSDGPAIVTEGLVKTFGDVRALDGVDLEAPARHGARAARPERRRARRRRCACSRRCCSPTPARRAWPASTSCATPPQLREQIGLAGQYAAVDENLTGSENLVMVGRLYGATRAQAKRPRARAARALRPRRRGRPPRQDLLGRHAPPARPRGRARRAPADPLPRRADHGPGPAQPARPLGDDRASSSPRARPCCSPPSTSTRPTGSPTRSRSSTTAR